MSGEAGTQVAALEPPKSTTEASNQSRERAAGTSGKQVHTLEDRKVGELRQIGNGLAGPYGNGEKGRDCVQLADPGG